MRFASLSRLCLFVLVSAVMAGGCAKEADTGPPAEGITLRISHQDVTLESGALMLVRVLADGRIVCDGEVVSLEELTAAARAKAAPVPQLITVVEAGTAQSCDRLEALLYALRQGGAVNIAFAHNLAQELDVVPVVLPAAGSASPPSSDRDRLTLAIGEGGELTARGREISRAGLNRHLRQAFEDNPNVVLQIDPLPQTTYADLLTVLTAARSAGMARIILWGRIAP